MIRKASIPPSFWFRKGSCNHMKRICCILWAVIALSVALAGCGDIVVRNEAARRESTGDSWTVMIYMCGSAMEENYKSAGDVISSLSYDLPKNINVLVETGGCRKWSIDDVDAEYMQYYTVQKNGIRLINQLPSSNMGEASTLASFLKWSVNNYPADHYMTIIWGNGGGPSGGVVYDSKYDFNELNVNELKSAFGSVGVTMDIIGFDSGLTANIETASAISLYADYMVASEDIMPMSGFDYEDIFDFISENPSVSAPVLAQRICNGAAAAADENEAELFIMSVVDLSKISMLSLAFDGVAQLLADSTAELSTLAPVRAAFRKLEMLGGNTQWEGYSNTADLLQIVGVLGSDFGSPAANLKNALNEAVIYICAGEQRLDLGGMAIYYPSAQNGEQLTRYKGLAPSSRYVEFLEKTCIHAENGAPALNATGAWQQYAAIAPQIAVSAVTDFEGRYIMAASHPELITKAYVNIYMYSEKDSKYIYLFSDDNVGYDPSRGGYLYEFNAKLPQLNRTDISMYPVSLGEKYDMYSIPVVYDGEPMNIRAVKYGAEDEYKVIGLWKGTDSFTSMADRRIKKLKPGEIIIPVYEVYGDGGNQFIEGSRVRIGLGDIRLTNRKITGGDYAISYTAEDIYGIKHESNTASLTAANGNIRITAN